MSKSSLVNFNYLLGTLGEPGRLGAAPQSVKFGPNQTILRILRDGMIPVSDLTERTQLSQAEILDAVEQLRALNQVEIVEVKEADGRKFIRLAPAGYAAANPI